MFSGLKKIFGGGRNEAAIKALRPLVEKINGLEGEVKVLADGQLKEKTEVLKKRVAEVGSLDPVLPEAFALVREAARRTLGQRHFDVQLMGGIILHRGAIAEMRTGEGKTLVATLPAYLNALTGKGVHIVTVNDYLSRRDAVWMGQIYNLLGLTVGVINHESSFLYDPLHISTPVLLDRGGGITNNQETITKLTPGVIPAKAGNQNVLDSRLRGNDSQKGEDALDKTRDELGSFKVVHEFLRPCTRREAYAADITYGTNNEFGFDYLRDNIEYEEKNLRQREHHFAIVDEVDSILIDEARTPLIISAPSGDSEDLYVKFAKIARGLAKDVDYKVDEKLHAATLTDAGIEKAERVLGVPNIYTEGGIKFVHHLETAVRAKALYEKDKEYVVKNDEVVIVDEFTGRLQPGRRWSEGLHQAIEAKEGVAIQKESRTFASITFQNYFRLYKKLSGMTGTAHTSAEEFYKVYGTDTTMMPTNKPTARQDGNDLIFQTEAGKFKAIARKVKELHAAGQPVLVGTVSIEKNELLGAHLKREGVPHEILNAKNHEREGEIIAQAGRRGAVTIATNMAGRGVDIKLGGNPAGEGEYEEVKGLGGLFVLGTERHEARRIDNQLRGRSARQGDPGATAFFVSLEDSLMRVFASDTIKKMMGRFGIPEDEPIENGIITRALETAQTKIEGFNFDARKNVLEFDDVLNHQRKIMYERRRKILLGSPEVIEEYLSSLLNSPLQKGVPESAKAGDVSGLQKVIEEKKKQFGNDFYSGVRRLALQTFDLFWIEHLEAMDYLRGSVNLRAYGQRDPLVEYKKEGLRMFKEMETAINEQIVRLVPVAVGAAGVGAAPTPIPHRLTEVHQQAQLIGSGDSESNAEHHGTPSPKNSDGEKVGRNDLCPCGSGKKFKKCHGK